MNKNLDFHYFLPIYLWVGKEEEIFHFSEKKGNFWEEWNLPLNEDKKMEDTWKFSKLFYVLSPQYFGLYNRGTTIIRLFREDRFPYETKKILPGLKRGNKKIYLFFKVFIYPFPDTTLLYINLKKEILNKVVLWDDDTKTKEEISSQYNFLPNKKNKKVFWFQKYNPYTSKFLYVYDFEPTFRFWKENNENICLPSHNSKGYNSLSECISKNKNSVKNKKVYVQNNSEPLFIISTTSKYPIRLYQKNIPSCFEFLFLLFFLIILLYKKK